MGTKINESIWGTVPTTGNNIRYNKSIRQLIADNHYNPVTGNLDLTICPWGIGYSNAGNWSIPFITKDSGDPSATGVNMKTIGCIDSKSYNTPFAFVGSCTAFDLDYGLTSQEFKKIIPSQKLFGETKISTNSNYPNYIVSSTSVDNGDFIPTGLNYDYDNSIASSVAAMTPAIYFSYQDFKVAITEVMYVNLQTGAQDRCIISNSTSWNNFVTMVNAMNLEDFAICGLHYNFIKRDSGTWSTLDYKFLQYLNRLPVEDRLKTWYFSDDDTDEYIPLGGSGFIGIHGNYASNVSWQWGEGGRSFPADNHDYSTATYHDNDDGIKSIWMYSPLNAATHFTEGKWEFADVTYSTKAHHWYNPANYNNTFVEVQEGDSFTFSGAMYSAPLTVIENSVYRTNAEAVKAVLLHEVAFLGFPFVWSGDTDYINAQMGNNICYVPKFDDHLITTGEYEQGAVAATLPNFSWQDVFSDTMPSYDPTYQPPKPDPESGDRGDLDNSAYIGQQYPGSNKFYALSQSDLETFIGFVNDLDRTETDTLRLNLDFKGSNPNDYIVGVYGYPFNLPYIATPTNIPIGPVTSNVSANLYEPTSSGVIEFGSVKIDSNIFDELTGDFRDYPPYTTLELYVPLCGNVELDPKFYIGHTLTLEGVFDVNTASFSVKVMRDSIVDKVLDGAIAVQIPITATNMGDYQNNVHQMRLALMNSLVGGASSITNMTTGAIQQTASGVSNGNPLAGLSTSSMDMFTTTYKASSGVAEAIYQLKHTPPTKSVTSTASSANASNMFRRPLLLMKRAKMLNWDRAAYGKTIGFACIKTGTVNDFSGTGYTICSNIDTNGITATYDEINEIKRLFTTGVYL